jgi:hypothetical protein
MSSVDTSPEAKTFAKTIIPLMKEYTKVFSDSVNRAYQIIEKVSIDEDRRKHDILEAECDRIGILLKTLSPPMKELASQVSQQIEHGKLDPLLRLELRLRLAELESAIQSADAMHRSATLKLLEY